MSNKNDNIISNIIIPFIIGGLILSTAKYVSSKLHNPKLAAIVAGVPIGLITMYFISTEEAIIYSVDYVYLLLIILMVSILYAKLIQNTKIPKNILVIGALLVWLVLSLLRYKITSSK